MTSFRLPLNYSLLAIFSFFFLASILASPTDAIFTERDSRAVAPSSTSIKARSESDDTNTTPFRTFSIANITNPSPNDILYGAPLGIKSSLPWWTPLPSAVLNLAICIKSSTADWLSNFGEDSPERWAVGLTTGEKFSVAVQWIELVYMLTQACAGLANLGHNGQHREFLRYGGAGSYALLLAAGIRLWTKLVYQSVVAKIASWILAVLALVMFVLLHLPDLGTAPLYELWSPGCVVSTDLVDNTSLFLNNTFDCASTSDLAVGRDVYGAGPTINVVRYGSLVYAGLMGLLLIWSAFRHGQFYFTRKGPNYKQPLAGSTVGIMLIMSFILSLLSFCTVALADRLSYISYYVCPDISNASTFTLVTRYNGSINGSACWAVEGSLPNFITNFKMAIELDPSNIARLINNF